MSNSGKATTEKNFEEAIESWLINHSGYTKADNTQFDAELGLDKTTLLAFIKDTQENTWEKLTASYGKSVEESVIKRIAKECDSRGLLDVLRNGVKDRGQLIRLAYFRPPTSLNPETEKLYAKNRLTVMRQIYYATDNKNSIDMLLSLNGLPIATAELKNAMTGQTVFNAIKQYKQDRQPTDKTKLIQYKKRALVHFAVDTDEVFMATRLSGNKTYFLPFNTGCDGGKGNPADHNYTTGYKTGYLWEEVWERDSWLDIIHRFINVQIEDTRDPATGKKKTKETLIFPRYHQLISTRKMLAATKAHGVGKNFLIQHSAGSGKTNTISWTAHQLASLHDDGNNPIYNSVIVVSDRRNLDKQLQDNIYQMEHKQGVVAKIDEDKHSSDLADELNKGTKIIITTLQKFSFLMGKVKDLSSKRFAVIVDEAHSSQGGRGAGNLRGVLGGALGDEELLTEAERLDALEPEPKTMEDLIIAEAKSRGVQPNVSFYAFTATPKAKTLEIFGVMGEDGKPHPFHLYSMRQAIEEKFILDVLEHYTTYKTYYKLSKAIEDDPEVDKKKAKKAIARFMSLHPHNIAQKTEIMVEHFRKTTSKKIGGKAKAMVVTRSRLHAVRYKQAFDKYITDKGYGDLKTLVAFSGTVEDPDVEELTFTEPNMNGFSEKELPIRFASPEFHVLIVAEKYQTGFDAPLLHTMFVDKPLSGLKAVQTLSRLNRRTSGKNSTFILDFANEMEDIKESFKPYFEQTEIEAITDHNHVYEIVTKIHQSPVIRAQDMDEFAEVYFKPLGKQTKRDHGMLNKWIDPAVARYIQEYRDPSGGADAYTEEGEEFKSNIQSFVRFYGFLSQIIEWQDADLEKLYAYGRYLLKKLPYRSSEGMLDLDDDVDLTSYRNEKTFDGSGALVVGDGASLTGGGDTGTGVVHDETAPLSEIIDVINERFGTDWTPEDMLVIEQATGDMLADGKLVAQARANSMDQFMEVFAPEVVKAFVTRKGRNEKIINDFMSNPAMREFITNSMLEDYYRRARMGLGGDGAGIGPSV